MVGNREKRGREVCGRRENRGREASLKKWREAGEKRGKLCNIAQYFAIKKTAKRWEPTMFLLTTDLLG